MKSPNSQRSITIHYSAHQLAEMGLIAVVALLQFPFVYRYYYDMKKKDLKQVAAIINFIMDIIIVLLFTGWALFDILYIMVFHFAEDKWKTGRNYIKKSFIGHLILTVLFMILFFIASIMNDDIHKKAGIQAMWDMPIDGTYLLMLYTYMTMYDNYYSNESVKKMVIISATVELLLQLVAMFFLSYYLCTILSESSKDWFYAGLIIIMILDFPVSQTVDMLFIWNGTNKSTNSNLKYLIRSGINHGAMEFLMVFLIQNCGFTFAPYIMLFMLFDIGIYFVALSLYANQDWSSLRLNNPYSYNAIPIEKSEPIPIPDQKYVYRLVKLS